MSETNREKQKLTNIKARAKTRRRVRSVIIIVVVVIMAAVIAASCFFLSNYKTYSSFTVTSTTLLSGGGDNLSFTNYADGYLQCSNNGAAYFTKDTIVWDEAFQMDRPILDTCQDYAAIADMRQNDVYLYDKNGLVSRISTANEIMDVEVAQSGMVALATTDGDCCYIELKASDGSDVINVKSVFSSSGYLKDITLSSDGTRLAAAFIYISQGSLESRVLFYDFSAGDTDGMLVGGFNQYTDTVLTDVEFMGDDTVCAVGDNALSFYSFSGEPSLISEELDLEWEIQSLSFTDKKLLLITKDDTNEYNYRAYVYNSSGKQVADCGFDFAYSKAQLAGSNNILLYSSTDCMVLSYKGLKRFSGNMGSRIAYMFPISYTFAPQFILSTNETVQFIKMK